MKLHTLKDLLHHELKDLYSAETQLVDALPKIADAVANPELRDGIEAHLQQTKEHVVRLDRIAERHEISLTGHTCQAMKGLLKEGAEWIGEDAGPEVRDAGIIGQAQRIEHYEIAGYGTAIALAKRTKCDDVVELLVKTLQEEKDTDAKLTKLAESVINTKAPVRRRLANISYVLASDDGERGELEAHACLTRLATRFGCLGASQADMVEVQIVDDGDTEAISRVPPAMETWA